jgi:hypothetical protein
VPARSAIAVAHGERIANAAASATATVTGRFIGNSRRSELV